MYAVLCGDTCCTIGKGVCVRMCVCVCMECMECFPDGNFGSKPIRFVLVDWGTHTDHDYPENCPRTFATKCSHTAVCGDVCLISSKFITEPAQIRELTVARTICGDQVAGRARSQADSHAHARKTAHTHTHAHTYTSYANEGSFDREAQHKTTARRWCGPRVRECAVCRRDTPNPPGMQTVVLLRSASLQCLCCLVARFVAVLAVDRRASTN